MPKFSIIIPTYNRKKLLKERALNSLLNQKFKDFEVIVINDGGEDVSDVIEEYKNKGLNINYISYKENKGPGYARNRGIEIAQSEWIAFLDDDDEYLPDALEIYDKNIEENLNYIIALMVYEFEGKKFILPRIKDREKLDKKILAKWISKWWLIPGNCIIKKNLILKLGGFDEKLKICEDAELFLRILFNTNPEEGKFIPFCVCIHYFHKGLGTGLKNEEKEKIITEPLYILDKHKKNLQRYKILKDFYYRIGFSYLWQGERLKAMKYLFLSLPKYHIKSIIRMLSVLLPNNLRYNLEDYLLKYKIKNLS